MLIFLILLGSGNSRCWTFITHPSTLHLLKAMLMWKTMKGMPHLCSDEDEEEDERTKARYFSRKLLFVANALAGVSNLNRAGSRIAGFSRSIPCQQVRTRLSVLFPRD